MVDRGTRPALQQRTMTERPYVCLRVLWLFDTCMEDTPTGSLGDNQLYCDCLDAVGAEEQKHKTVV